MLLNWRDYKDFLDDLEEDKEYRQQVNIFFGELLLSGLSVQDTTTQ